MGKLKELFIEIYGLDITQNLLKKTENGEQFVPKETIAEALRLCTKRESKCSKCPGAQHQDFPGFCGKIQYNEKNKVINKDILIFGLEVSSKTSILESFLRYTGVRDSHIHIWYDLGYFKKEEIDKLLANSPLWPNIDLFLPLKDNINRMYGTDLAKCYSTLTKEKKRTTAFENCREYLFRELECFKDDGLIFIFQGNDCRDYFENYVDLRKNDLFITFLRRHQIELEIFGITPTKGGDFPIEIGTFSSNEESKTPLKKSGKYLRIYHSSKQNENTFWKKLRERISEEPLYEMVSEIKKFLL